MVAEQHLSDPVAFRAGQPGGDKSGRALQFLVDQQRATGDEYGDDLEALIVQIADECAVFRIEDKLRQPRGFIGPRHGVEPDLPSCSAQPKPRNRNVVPGKCPEFPFGCFVEGG